MKFKGIFFCALLILSTVGLKAQTRYLSTDLGLGAGQETFFGTLSLKRTHTLLNEKIHLGYGLRFNLHNASNQKYATAPFKYTQNSLIDTMIIGSVNTMSFSATINLGFAVTEKLLVGFNIDAIGLSIGSEQDVRIKQWVADPSGSTQTTTTAKPTFTNILLVGDNDRGTLNSEFFVRYMLTDYLGARAGMSMFFSEYTTEAAGHDGNNRFRNKLQYPFVAITLKL